MARVKKQKPTSPGRRFATYSDRVEVTKERPEKSLTEGISKSGGRNKHGRKTSRHRGGGAKRLYRKVDFRRRKDGVPAKVAAIEYDPNRTAYIALLHYADGEKRYILAPQRLSVGDTVANGPTAEIAVGNCLPLRSIPTGTTVHNVELQPGRGGQLGRSAGAAIQLSAKEGKRATLRLPSGEMRMVELECRATIGSIGHVEHQNVDIGKAGRARHLGRRPRGVDHAGTPSRHSLGCAHARLSDPQEGQAVRPLHRPPPAPGPAPPALGSRKEASKCPVRRRRARGSKSG
jgi:large subunit ribosomal protein L2